MSALVDCRTCGVRRGIPHKMSCHAGPARDRKALTSHVLGSVRAERDRQHARWGVQRFPHGDCLPRNDEALRWVRRESANAEQTGTLTWRNLIDEELCEARVESDPALKRAELVQLAALIVQQIESIDRDAMEAK